MTLIIDDMPGLTQVEQAPDVEICRWHLFLRPTMSNDELVIVKAIAQRYERMDVGRRETFTAQVRREHA